MQAAKIILDYTLKARELFDHGARLRAIEDALKRSEVAKSKQLAKGEAGAEEDDDDD